ncbi:ROK family protein [Streptomyces sp. NPDC058295]|uniref:ROK family protein n=1 Tax=Streptomyces sp. NPDC058295 TaxID=3346431 RepID=UPI0036E10E1B
MSLDGTAARHQHAVIDIGGTWFRSAVREPDGTLSRLVRKPSVNYLNHPQLSQTQLRQRLIDYIVQQTRELGLPDTGHPLRVSISMGAAVNSHTGAILNAGPLWGPASEPFDLRDALTRARSDVKWSVVNDVTALATYFASKPEYQRSKKICVLTVSTGIASRTIEVASRRVPVHPTRGIQGEIGHIPIDFQAGGSSLDLRCDCGGQSHLNAYCSGRGIPRVMARLAPLLGQSEWRTPAIHRDPALWARLLRSGLEEHEPAARLLLEAVVRPIARAIISLLSVDPEVNQVVVTGGVPQSLGRFYEAALVRNLTSLGLYMISDEAPDYFSGIVDFAESEVEAGLHGAALAAECMELSCSDPTEDTSLLSHRSRRMTEGLALSYSVTMAEAGKSLVGILHTMSAGIRPVILADATVSEIYGTALKSELEAAGFRPILKSVAAGESSKSWTALEFILSTMESIGVSRNQHPVVALGGGAVLDAVGLAAGLYRRGVPYVRVPTSLVGLIDAGVGAKVAINLFGRKNRAGLFYPPKAVILDVAFLQTLPTRFMVSGVAEAIKIAVVEEGDLFSLLESHSDRICFPAFYRTEEGLELVARAADAMMSSLSGNLWEGQLNRSVDFGHTLSSVLEMNSHAMTHGEAVTIDMALSLEIGLGRGVTSSSVAQRIVRLARRVGLPLHSENVTADQLFSGLEEAASHRGGRQRFPLIREIGAPPVFVSDVVHTELREAWARLVDQGRRGGL